MRVGAWFHTDDGVPLDAQFAAAAAQGVASARSYDIGYNEQAASALKATGMSLFAGLWIDAVELAADWRSQIHEDELERLYALDVPLDAVCVGNELREGGDDPKQKRFTARLAFGLANLLATYRDWQVRHGVTTPLTYAMESIAFDVDGTFHEWVWPLIDACDVVSINLYTMDDSAWFGFDAFAVSRQFLCEPDTRHKRLALFEHQLRCVLQQLQKVNKPVILSETGIPSAIDYQIESNGMITYKVDGEGFSTALHELLGLIQRVSDDYAGRISSIYLYEWRDNQHHRKITNIEQSPIHATFGLCDRSGTPKFDIKRLLTMVK